MLCCVAKKMCTYADEAHTGRECSMLYGLIVEIVTGSRSRQREGIKTHGCLILLLDSALMDHIQF